MNWAVKAIEFILYRCASHELISGDLGLTFLFLAFQNSFIECSRNLRTLAETARDWEVAQKKYFGEVLPKTEPLLKVGKPAEFIFRPYKITSQHFQKK